MDHARKLFSCDFVFLRTLHTFLDDECDQAEPVYMLNITADGQRKKLLVETDNRVAFLQQTVGGYFEHVRVNDNIHLYVDEEAGLKNPRPLQNQVVFKLFEICVLGDVLVFGGFDECGNELACPADLLLSF